MAPLKAQLRGPQMLSKLMALKSTWQRDDDMRKLIAVHVEDLTALLGWLATSSRTFTRDDTFVHPDRRGTCTGD